VTNTFDVREGLEKESMLIKKEVLFHQGLDYEGIPFRCHQSHKHGHNDIQFTFPFQPHNGGHATPTSKKWATPLKVKDQFPSSSYPGVGTCLFWEEDLFWEKIYYWRTCLRRPKNNMQKKKEKKCGVHADRPDHFMVRVFSNIVMVISQ
jgi:hypothetical protein